VSLKQHNKVVQCPPLFEVFNAKLPTNKVRNFPQH